MSHARQKYLSNSDRYFLSNIPWDGNGASSWHTPSYKIIGDKTLVLENVFPEKNY